VAKNWKKLSLSGGIIVLVALVPLMTQRTDFLTWFTLILLYVTLSQSWNILGGYTGQINLGHVAFFGVGALTTRYLWLLFGLPLPVALLAGAVAAPLVALVIGVPAFRLRGIYFIIGSLVFAEILRHVAYTAIPVASVLPAELLTTYSLVPRYYLSLTVAVVAVGVVYLVSKSRLGLGMMAVREDEDAARTSGVSILRCKLSAFLISTALAGLAGGVFAYYYVGAYAGHLFEPVWTFDSVLIVFVGGAGTIIGPIIGSVFFVFLQQWLATILPGGFHLVVFGVIFILVVLYWPGGIVGGVVELRRRHRR